MVTALTLTLVGAPIPQVGSRMGVEVAWTNTGPTPVRVPQDWASHLTVDAIWLPRPDEAAPQAVKQSAFEPIPAASVKWMTVAAGAKLTASTDIASLLPRKCTPGCASGLYVVDAAIEPRTWTGLEADQLQPLGEARLTFVIPAAVGTAGADAVAVKVAPKVEGAAVAAWLSLKNTSDRAIWLPNTWSYTCTSDWDTGTGRAGAGAGVAFGGQGTYGDETTRTRLGAGRSTKFSVPCGDPPPAGAKDLHVAVTLAPMNKFWPRDPHPEDAALEAEISAK